MRRKPFKFPSGYSVWDLRNLLINGQVVMGKLASGVTTRIIGIRRVPTVNGFYHVGRLLAAAKGGEEFVLDDAWRGV